MFAQLAGERYRNSAVALLIYDVTRRGSFQQLPVYLKALRKCVMPSCIIVLLGNKVDNDFGRQVSIEVACLTVVVAVVRVAVISYLCNSYCLSGSSHLGQRKRSSLYGMLG